jgi:FlaA1/EpsC-like NDP-sugar epimerase
MSTNPAEAVTNNILGTRTLLELAHYYNARRLVLLSTSQAVYPTNIMGVTKRISELLVQDFAGRTGRNFSVVRFGNLLSGRGSVVLIFKRQIEKGGPVCVTHPDVTRYFMTIPEAVQLILQAGAMGEGGEVFVLDMGEQVKVIDVARDLIRLSGFTEAQIGITITGLRPGEKLHEELFYPGEGVVRTAHERLFVAHPLLTPRGGSTLLENIDLVLQLAEREMYDQMKEVLRLIVPGYTASDELGSPSALGYKKPYVDRESPKTTKK